MAATLIFRSRFQYPDGAVREMVLWRLPKATTERPHGFKYRLYYGLESEGISVRYDNERGKGDHRHIGDKEESYEFVTVEKLVADFLSDIERVRRRNDEG
jgi:hypothetical protein